MIGNQAEPHDRIERPEDVGVLDHPPEAEAAQLDGAGPVRFLWSFLLPLSWANIAALFVVLFIISGVKIFNEYERGVVFTLAQAAS